MRVVIDQCVDPRVKPLLGECPVATVHEQGWDELEDGPLLAAARKEFDILLAIDQNMDFQPNFREAKLGVVVAHVPKSELAHCQRIQKELLAAIKKVSTGEVIHIRQERLTRPSGI
jgi:hypothetical protein